jgi:hypothetical protein
MRLSCVVTTVPEIEEAIVKLPEEQQRELAVWLGDKLGGEDVKTIDRGTFESASEKVFSHYKPLLKALSE